MASRSPIQLGAEIYGDESLAADVEVIRLMLATLDAADLEDKITLDLGHVGVYEAVIAAAGLDDEQERTVFDALQRKSVPDLMLALDDVAEAAATLIIGLVDLHGDDSVLAAARELFEERVPAALAAVDELQEVAADIRRQRPDLPMYFDLAELDGYHYHTGVTFSAYVPGHGQALARGGRYNGVGEVFGRSRPATGFATDLKALLGLLPAVEAGQGAISMPDSDDSELLAKADELRAAGEIVINTLGGERDARCDRELVEAGGHWQVQSI
jgi:ATP phosphoribosyltransferase regulatory subunit